MGGKHRTVLGRHEDVRIGAAKTGAGNAFATTSLSKYDRERMIKAAQERARRFFAKQKTKNSYAIVTKAYFNHLPWQKTGLPRSSFFHALKKVKKFFQADKHWVKSTSEQTSKRFSLD